MARPIGTTGSRLKLGMQFAQWATTLERPPTVQQIRDTFGITLDTARSWRTTWLSCLPNPYSRGTPGGNRIHADQEPTP